MTKRYCMLVLGLTAIVGSVACAPPAAQESPAIAARSAAWGEAFNAGDVEALKALYTEDGRLLPPNAPMVTGREAIGALFGAMTAGGMSGTLATIEAIESGDVGYHVGTFTLTAGGQEVDRGKFIEVWRKDGDAWLISADMFSSDLPAAPEGELRVFTHEVEDVDHWWVAWHGEESRNELFAEHGVPSITALRTGEGNTTALVAWITDMEAFHAMLASEEGQAAAAADGVDLESMAVYEP